MACYKAQLYVYLNKPRTLPFKSFSSHSPVIPWNDAGLAITLRNFEVLGSNLDCETGYSDCVFFVCEFLQTLQANSETAFNWAPNQFILHTLIHLSMLYSP
jgi:hypothetical protein